MFKDGISVPGLTLTCSLTCHRKRISVSLTKLTATCITLSGTTTQAGPVSFFTATMKPAKQRSGKQRKARLLSYVKKIVGYDANALYLWAVMQNMPTGSYTRRLAENEFKPKGSIKMAIE